MTIRIIWASGSIGHKRTTDVEGLAAARREIENIYRYGGTVLQVGKTDGMGQLDYTFRVSITCQLTRET